MRWLLSIVIVCSTSAVTNAEEPLPFLGRSYAKEQFCLWLRLEDHKYYLTWGTINPDSGNYKKEFQTKYTYKKIALIRAHDSYDALKFAKLFLRGKNGTQHNQNPPD